MNSRAAHSQKPSRRQTGRGPDVARPKEERAAYVALVDTKRRVTIRGTTFRGVGAVTVRHRKDGSILLKPLEWPGDISPQALEKIARSMAGGKAGQRSKPLNLKALIR